MWASWVLVLAFWPGMTWAVSVAVHGELRPGGYGVVQAPVGSVVRYNGRSIRVDELGQLPIGFARDQRQAVVEIQLPDGRRIERSVVLTPRQYDIQRINGLKKQHVSPDKETLKRIRADIAKAKAARQLFLRQPKGWLQRPFVWPTGGIISGVYGSQRILNGQPRRPHFGVDIAAPRGTPVYAPAEGKVTLAASMVLSGNTLMIDHGYGLRSTFMHLNRLLVKPGSWVKKGQQVGEVGATGRATGPHLHWGMSWFNVRLDPALFVGAPTLKKGDRVRANTTAVAESAGK